jgi:hypothetical protein
MTPQAAARGLAGAYAAVSEQRRWVEDHGGSRAGYVARYGDSSAPADERQGDGGQAIYNADIARLRDLEADLASLAGRAALARSRARR